MADTTGREGGLRSLTGEQLLRLYGPTLALILALVLLIVMLPTEKAGDALGINSGGVSAAGPGATIGGSATGTDSGSATGVGGGTGTVTGAVTGSAGSAASATGPGGGPGQSGPAAVPTGATTADGKVAIVKSGPDCRADGRMIGISVWQPPCVDWKPGTDNGGATARGVTADKVVVEFYEQALNTASFAVGTAAGIQQSKEQIETYAKLWLNYYNNHTQTYGRQVEFKFVDGSGTDDAALRADVRRAAVEHNAFAFIGACCNRAQLQEAGAHQLPMVNSPGQPLTDDLAQNPVSITRAPTVEWVFEDAGSYICQRLAGHKAKWGGDDTVRAADRKFGLMYSEGSGAGGAGQGPAVPFIEREMAKCGQQFAAKVGISSDTSAWSNETSTAMARMKLEGVTTIVYFAPILSQVFATQAADQQQYNPEYYIGGTCCNDAVIVNRAASQTQADQFFGTSNQFAWWNDDASTFEAVREADAGNGAEPLPNEGSSGSATNNAALTGTIWWPLIQGFFGCLQMAGPTLTPETWREGCNRYGTAGGYTQEFGFPTRFFTPERPFMIQDQTEWWWSTTTPCNDEANRAGRGCTLWVQNGKRTGFKEWPKGEPDLFNPKTAFITPNPPVVWDETRPVDKRCMSCA